jgi:hypothetical protein
MLSTHCKRIAISARAFTDLSRLLKDESYTPTRREGFVLTEATPSRLEGRYLFTRVQKIRGTNPKTLEIETEERPVLLSCSFALNATKGLIRCNERRADLGVLEEAFQNVGVQLTMEDIATDVVKVFQDLRDAHGKVDLRAIRIQGFSTREGMTTTANFKITQAEYEEKILANWAGDTIGFTATVRTEEGRQAITVGKKGSIRWADDLGDDIVEMVLGFLLKHHEEVELQTVEI